MINLTTRYEPFDHAGRLFDFPPLPAGGGGWRSGRAYARHDALSVRPFFLLFPSLFPRTYTARAFFNWRGKIGIERAFDTVFRFFLQFYQLLEASQVANTTLTYRHVTVFAPTNRAFQKHNGSTKNLVLYHMCE
jgi:hypothetical protein